MRRCLVLGSRSPARLRTLRSAGVDPHVVVSGVDESTVGDADPAALAVRLAELKGLAVSRMPLPCAGSHRAVLVACDSVFEFSGDSFGKPRSGAEARDRLRRMSGHSGVLHTGHFVRDAQTGRTLLRGARTVVSFGSMSDAEIDAYVATGEPLGVAGGFAIDGLAGPFVDGIDGDPHNVIGISLPLVRRMLAELEIGWQELWAEG